MQLVPCKTAVQPSTQRCFSHRAHQQQRRTALSRRQRTTHFAPCQASTAEQAAQEAIERRVDDEGAAGYVAPDKLAVKAQHKKQMQSILCARCQALSNGAMIPAVEDFSQKLAIANGEDGEDGQDQPRSMSGKRLLQPQQLRDQLVGLVSKRCIVVLLVDLLDASGSFLPKVRDLVGRNPIILIGTKADLLPAAVKPRDVEEWLLATAAHKRLNVISTHVVSSKTGMGLGKAAAALRVERQGRDVYVMGAANVGKSAFVRAFVREMSSFSSKHYDAAATLAARRLPVESAMPGTTLGVIPMETFAAGGTLYDTPGVHLHHRIAHMLTPEELKSIHPRRKLRVYVPPTPLDITRAVEEEEQIAAGTGGDVTVGGVAAGGDSMHSRDSVFDDHAMFGEDDIMLGEEEDVDHDVDFDFDHDSATGQPTITDNTPIKVSSLAWDADDTELLSLFDPLVGDPTTSNVQAVAAALGRTVEGGKRGGGGKGKGKGGSLQTKKSKSTRNATRPTPQHVSATYLWGGVGRIDVLEAPAETVLTFYGPPCLHVEPLPLLGEEDLVELDHHAEDDGESVGLFGQQSVLARGGLRVAKTTTVQAVGLDDPMTDIALSGLPGWVAVSAPGARGPITLRLWAPRGVEVFVRPPLPVPSAVQVA